MVPNTFYERAKIIAIAFSASALTGCLALFDFGDYDTSQPDASAVDAALPAESGDFSLNAPPSISVFAGESSTAVISINRVEGFTGSVAVAIGGVPAGVTTTPSNDVAIADSASSAEISFAVAPTAVPTTAKITLSASGGDRLHETSLDLLIVPTPGSLDITFGNNGIATTEPSSDYDLIANTMMIDSDDRIAMGGVRQSTILKAANVVAVFDANGTPTAAFNEGSPLFLDGLSGIAGIVRMPNGALLAATGDGSGITAYRIAPDGTIDPESTVAIAIALTLTDAKLRKDGRVVLGGNFGIEPHAGFAILDNVGYGLATDVGDGGVLDLNSELQSGQVGGSIAIASGDQMVIPSASNNDADGCEIRVFDANGALESELSTAPGVCSPTDVAVDSAGYIAFTGYGNRQPSSTFIVGRIAFDGNASEWGNLGVTIDKPPLPNATVGSGVTFDSAGRVLCAVRMVDPSIGNNLGELLLLRYTRSGKLDTGFNKVGYVVSNIALGFNPVRVFTQKDGRIVVGGTALLNGKMVFALARYWP